MNGQSEIRPGRGAECELGFMVQWMEIVVIIKTAA